MSLTMNGSSDAVLSTYHYQIFSSTFVENLTRYAYMAYSYIFRILCGPISRMADRTLDTPAVDHNILLKKAGEYMARILSM